MKSQHLADLLRFFQRLVDAYEPFEKIIHGDKANPEGCALGLILIMTEISEIASDANNPHQESAVDLLSTINEWHDKMLPDASNNPWLRVV